MDQSDYPLAQADRAFAYEGAYRTPSAMSAATREAYGMRLPRKPGPPDAFRVALRLADPQAHGAGTASAACRVPSASYPRPNLAGHSPRQGAQQAAADRAASFACAKARNRSLQPRPTSFYYISTSAAGCDVRAIVWRGRVYCGGKRPCPTSTP
jgi:hypothetical protein